MLSGWITQVTSVWISPLFYMHWLHVRPNSDFPPIRHFICWFLAVFHPKFTSKIRKKKISFSSIFLKTLPNVWQTIRRSAKSYFPKSESLLKGTKKAKKIRKFAEFRYFSWILLKKICRKSAYKKTKICQKSAYFPGNRNSASRVANAFVTVPLLCKIAQHTTRTKWPKWFLLQL